jgi:cytochrome c oxidase assembly protein subunit 15
MVLVGGITRLTHSGLSIVRWQPISGVLPPLSQGAWQAAFAEYQQYSEFQLIHPEMTLSEFKFIYFWEYLHRLLGRILGIVFIIPWVVFWVRKKIHFRLAMKTLVGFALGGLQGILGWYMVHSGLLNSPLVSHYRLAAHLLLSSAILSYFTWIILDLRERDCGQSVHCSNALRVSSVLLTTLVVMQIFFGALVAGLKAGFIYNTFPKMGATFIPPGIFSSEPWWKNFLENPVAVQFIHRLLGMGILTLAIALGAFGFLKNMETVKNNLLALTGVVVLQVLLGVTSLLLLIPITLAVAHQLGALILLQVSLTLTHQFYRSH